MQMLRKYLKESKARQQDLNRKVWEESLKEKDEIISARTQADLAAKERQT